MCGLFISNGLNKAPTLIKDVFLGELNSRGPDSNFIYEYNGTIVGQTILSFSRSDSVHHEKEHISPDGRYIVLLNGEIYNWKDLALKYEIECISDIDLLTKLVPIQNIESIINNIKGMYIIAIFDNVLNTITVIRDSLGEKNAYYYFESGKLLISSTIRPIKKLLQDLTINDDYLKNYFCTRHLLSDYMTSYKEIRRFKPGAITVINLNNKTIQTQINKRISDFIDSNYYYFLDSLPEIEFLDLVKNEFIKTSKQIQNNSRNIGSICSGGLDSSLASYFSHKYNPELKSVALLFYGKDMQAKEFNDHQNLIDVLTQDVTPEIYLENMLSAYDIVQGPLPTHSFPSQLIVSKFAKEKNILSLITGDGGDELYGGYTAYQNLNHCNLIPSIYSKVDYCELFSINPSEEFKKFMNDEWVNSLSAYNFLSEDESYLQSVLLMDSGIQLESTALLSSDLLTSAIGMEARGFYLMDNIVTLALNMPIKYKLKKDYKGKYINRPLIKNIYREKFNVSPPIKQGFSGYPEVAFDYLNNNFKLPFDKTSDLLKFNIKEINKMSKEIKWKVLNLSLFLNTI